MVTPEIERRCAEQRGHERENGAPRSRDLRQNAWEREEKNEDRGKENESCQRLAGAQSLASLGHRLKPRLSAPSKINHANGAAL